jgi:hypothetical protein
MPGILDLSRSDPGGILPDWLSRGPRGPAHDLVALGWRGLQALAPNITDPATYAPLPPPSLTPTPEGKLPAADRDPRVEGVLHDLFNIGLTFAPMPGAGPAAGAARWLPRLAQRTTPRLESLVESLASRNVALYNPPVKPPRHFNADYPHGAPADATGRLTHDIEGRPLGARYVAGRTMVGGTEQAIPPTEFDALAAAITGHYPKAAPKSQLGAEAGRYAKRRGDRLAELEYGQRLPQDDG